MPLSLSARLDSLFAPGPDKARVNWLAAQPFAHRGVHGGNVLENSLSAFSAAIARGHGIECDVQQASDGTAFVFHDAELSRLSQSAGIVAEQSSAGLDGIQLNNGNGKIPRLTEMLAHVVGQVPILIEIKIKNSRVGPVCLSVRRALEGYRGRAAIMSFNPLVADWFRENAPHITRGLVVTEENGKDLKSRFVRHAALWKAKPDFLAYDIRSIPSPIATAAKARGMPVLCWTVKSAADERNAITHATEIIYEMTSSGASSS